MHTLTGKIFITLLEIQTLTGKIFVSIYILPPIVSMEIKVRMPNMFTFFSSAMHHLVNFEVLIQVGFRFIQKLTICNLCKLHANIYAKFMQNLYIYTIFNFLLKY